LNRVSTETSPDQSFITLSVDLTAQRFAQLMQGRLFVVRPGLLNSGGEYYFTLKQRSTPVKLEGGLRHDSIRMKLPPGLKLDELPTPAKIESPYGTLEATWSVKDGEIVMQETLEIRETLAPPSAYAKIREFFEQVAGVHAAPIVLVKE
jgi:hypothetical protein